MPNLTVQDRTIIAALRKNTPSGGGSVVSVTGDGTTASVDNTDPSNPVVSASLALASANSYTDAQIAALPPPGISDAPSDGKTYGRKDGAWAETTAGASVGAVGTCMGPPLGETGIVLPPRTVTIPLPSGYAFTGWRILCSPAATVEVDVRYIPTLGLPSAGDSITPFKLSTSASGSAAGNTSSWSTTTVSGGGTIAIALTTNDVAVSVAVSLDGDKV